MIIFSGGQDKAKILSLLRQNLEAFVFPGCTHAQRMMIHQHLEWMRIQPDKLHVNCTFETFPETKVTNIIISASFLQKPLERK